MKAFKGKNILEITEFLGGNILKKIVGTIFCATLFMEVSTMLMRFAESTKIAILPVTPILIVEGFFLIGMIISAYIGIESISRMHLVFYPLIIVGLLIVILGVIPNYKFANIFPILGTGPKNIFIYSINELSIFSELLAFYVLWAFGEKNNTINKNIFKGILLSIVIFTVSTLSFVMIFPYPKSNLFYLPFFKMARIIEYGKFFQRIESIFVLFWIFSGLLYLSLMFFVVLNVFQKSFNLKYYQPLIFPFAILTLAVSIIPENLAEMNKVYRENILKYSWTVAIILPLLICILAYIKMKKRKKGDVENDETI